MTTTNQSTQAHSTVSLHSESQQLSRNEARAELTKQGITEETFSEHLASAAEAGDSKMVNLLIAAGADVNYEEESGRMPLLGAAYSNHANIEIIRALIAAGADVNRPNKSKCYPIELASSFGHADRVRELIAAGANVNVKNQFGCFPLELAAEKGYMDCLKALVDAGANVNASNKTEATALMGASLCGKAECVKALLEAKAEVNHTNMQGITALHMAAVRGHSDCIKLLLAAGADLNKKANDGRTALDMAVENKNEDCVKLLKTTPHINSMDKKESIDDKACKLYSELFALKGLTFLVGDSFDLNEEVDDETLLKHPVTRMVHEHLSMGHGPESLAMLSIMHMGSYNKLSQLRFCLAAGAEVYKDKASGEVMVNLPNSKKAKPVKASAVSPQRKIKKTVGTLQLPPVPNKEKKPGNDFVTYMLITLIIALIVACVILVM